MAVFNGATMTKLEGDPQVTPDPGEVGGSLRVFEETVTYATQTTADTINIARLPKGARVLYGIISTSVTTATATVAIGITGTTGKYRAAATVTNLVADIFGVHAGLHSATTAQETVFITIATASLPASGTLKVAFIYTVN